jgi:hypothetical protein
MAALVLQYAGGWGGTRPRRRIVAPAIFPILLTFAHINLAWQISQLMIARVCWADKLDFSLWVPAAWAPGLLVARHSVPLGLLLMLIPSILAGQLLWQTILRCRDGLRPILDISSLRCAAMLLLWTCWLPMPAPYSVAYLFSRWAVNMQ